MEPKNYYTNLLDSTEIELISINKKIKNNAFARLVIFLAIFGAIFGLTPIALWAGIVTAILMTILFGVLIKRQIKFQKQKSYLSAKALICKNELNALNFRFDAFRDGKNFGDGQHSFSNDLDLFGKNSLFQRLNRTATYTGENFLAQSITTETLNSKVIKEEQEAVIELKNNPDFLLHFRSIGSTSDIAEEGRDVINIWRSTQSYISKIKLLRPVSIIFPALALTALLYLIITGSGSSAFITLFILNIIITGAFLKRTNKEHERVSTFLKVIKKYSDLVYTIETTDFKSEKLSELYQILFSKKHNAATALYLLSKKVNALDSRLNVFAGMILGGLFQWDFQCIYQVEKWRKLYSDNLFDWLDAIAMMDAMISKGTYSFNNPDFVYPSIEDEKYLTGQNMGHPFLPAKKRVGNDFEISNEKSFTIITGANMAGKSTFLRTIGINLVLAMAGLPVAASTFRFRPCKIFSSMRTADSLTENESYFYAELKRLKDLIEILKKGDRPFIILDEILKGTNSIDKQNGSRKVLQKIIELEGTGIIATHDLSLTNIEKEFPQIISNKCFEIEIDNASINFDYKLYDGVTKKMNAMLLMEQMGIV